MRKVSEYFIAPKEFHCKEVLLIRIPIFEIIKKGHPFRNVYTATIGDEGIFTFQKEHFCVNSIFLI